MRLTIEIDSRQFAAILGELRGIRAVLAGETDIDPAAVASTTAKLKASEAALDAVLRAIQINTPIHRA